jgi:hypothetical protein
MAKTTITYASNYKKPRRLKQGKVSITCQLAAKVRHAGDRGWSDLGVISERIVTAAFIALITDELTNTDRPAMQTLKFHDSGTGTNVESGADTTLQTPTGESRDSGTQTVPGAGQYQTVATHTYSNPFAVTEHGVFSAASGGTLLDRSKFAAINVVNGSQIQWTYTLTITGS